MDVEWFVAISGRRSPLFRWSQQHSDVNMYADISFLAYRADVGAIRLHNIKRENAEPFNETRSSNIRPPLLSGFFVWLEFLYKEKKMNNKNQNGRSMIEMLGVLAIIGVLSVGGIAGYSKAMMTMKINKTIEQISHMAAAIKTAYMNQSGFIDEYGDPCGKYSFLDKATAVSMGVVPDEIMDDNTLKNAFGGNVDINFVYDRSRADYAYGGAFSIRYDGIPKEACIALATRDWNGIFQGIDFGNYSNVAGMYEGLLLDDAAGGCEMNDTYNIYQVAEGIGFATIGCNNEPFNVSPADAALGCTCENGLCSIAFVSED